MSAKLTAAEKEEQDQQRYEELLLLSNQGDETVKTVGPWLTAEERVEINLLRCRIRKRRSRQRLRMMRSGIPVTSAIDEHVMEYRKQLDECIAEMRDHYPTVLFGHMKSSRFSISSITYTKTVDLIRSAFFKDFHSRVKNTSYWKFSRVPGEMGEGRYQMYDAIDRVLQDLRIFDKTDREKWMNGKSAPSHLRDISEDDGGASRPNFFATLLFSPTRCEPTSSPSSPMSGSSSPPPPLNRVESCKRKYLECWTRFETELQQRLREQPSDNLCNFFSKPVFKPIEEPKSRTNWTNSWLCTWRMMNFRDLFFLKLSIYRLLVDGDRDHPLWDMVVDGCVFVPEKILLGSLRRLDRKLRSRKYRVPEPVRLLDAPMTPSNSCASSQSEPFEDGEFGSTTVSEGGDDPRDDGGKGEENGDGDEDERDEDSDADDGSPAKDASGENPPSSLEIVREMMQNSSADDTTMSNDEGANDSGDDGTSVGVREERGSSDVYEERVDENRGVIYPNHSQTQNSLDENSSENYSDNDRVSGAAGEQVSFTPGDKRASASRGNKRASGVRGNKGDSTGPADKQACLAPGDTRSPIASSDNRSPIASGDNQPLIAPDDIQPSFDTRDNQRSFAVAFNQPPFGAALNQPEFDVDYGFVQNRSSCATGYNQPAFDASVNQAPVGPLYNQSQGGSDHYQPQVGSGHYQSQVGSEHYQPQVGSEHYQPQVGSDHYPPQVDSGHYPPQVRSGHYQPQIVSGQNQPQFGPGRNQFQFGAVHVRSPVYSGESSSTFGASGTGQFSRSFEKRSANNDGGGVAAKRFKGGQTATNFYDEDDEEEYESIQPSRAAASSKISKFFKL